MMGVPAVSAVGRINQGDDPQKAEAPAQGSARGSTLSEYAEKSILAV